MKLTVRALEPGQALATWGPVVIRVITTARTELADIDRLDALAREILASSPVAGMWIVVHHGAPILDGPTRRYAGAMLERFGERLVVSYALLGLGFWASAAIAATMVLNKLMGQQSPIETSLERSAERLCMDLIGLDPAGLLAAHDELLRRIQHAHSPAGVQL